MQPGDQLTLIYLRKESYEDSLTPGDYSNDPQLEALIALYHKYGYNLLVSILLSIYLILVTIYNLNKYLNT